MAKDTGDLEKALRVMDDSAPAPDLRVHPMGVGAINKFAAKLNRDLPKWPLYYWHIVVSVLALTNYLFVGGTMLTVIFFLVFLAAIGLLFRAVIKQAA